MNKFIYVILTASIFSYSLPSEAANNCRWIQGKGRVCTPVLKKTKVVVVKSGHHHSISPWSAFAGVVGTAIIIDKLTGEPKVEGKDSFVIETKLIEAGKVDVIEKEGKVIFIKGIG